MKLVIMGDSITAGQLLPADQKAWPDLITGWEVIARGAPGETTRQALERWPAGVQQVQPDAVIIQFGHNDANRWDSDGGLHRVSPAAFAANLREMVDRSLAFGALPILCSLTPSMRSQQHAVDTHDYDRLLRGVAKSEGVRLIDVRAAFLAFAEGPLTIDGLHLNAEGHCLYAKTVQRHLDSWYKR